MHYRYTTTRDPPPRAGGRAPRSRRASSPAPAVRAQRGKAGGNGGIYGGKGGCSSSDAFSPGGTQWKCCTISTLQTAASAGRPTRLISWQAASTHLGSCHGKVGYFPKIPPKNHSSQKCNSDFLCKGDFGRQESNSPHLRESRALIPGSEGNTALGLLVTLVSSQTSPRLLTQSWINPEARCHSWHSCGSVWCVCVCARARVGACSRV